MQPLGIGLVIANRVMAEEVRACLESLPVNILFRQGELTDLPPFLEQVQRFRPDVLLIDLSALPRPFDQTLRRIKLTPAAPLIVALNDSTDTEIILTAVRAGAGEYLYPPFRDGLHAALERMGEERARSSSEGRIGGKTLGFLSAKGGCGATTLACHVAVALQRLTGQDVLLADFDLDSGMVSFIMQSHTPYSIVDAARNTHRLDLSYWKALVANAGSKLDVIPAPVSALPRDETPAQEYRTVLRFVRSAYDWVVVDLGRSLETFSVNLLDEVDEAFLVASVDLPSLHQTKQVLQVLLDCGYNRNRVRLILNRLPKRPDISTAEVEKLVALPVFAMLPNDGTDLNEALAQGELLPAGTALGKQFEKLAQKIAGPPPGDAAKLRIQ